MIQLPILPRGTTVKPRLVRYGGDLVSSLGGPTQRITRPGTRYAADVTLPNLDSDCAARWQAAELAADAAGDTVGLVMPQTIKAASSITGTTGSGNAGSTAVTLAGSGRPPVGSWFSVRLNGRHYLHLVTAVAGLNITVAPALRVSLPPATPLDFQAPILEGYPDQAPTWSVEYFRFVGHSISITESA